ncbi:WS/DGAT/MGAT family acyltransferase [Prauserella shujinwangii]|uniref:diacylglycerol O-acyltransferase n=1 Tax=Prauserella shujinwangii TaxID=1453103 RepID=A0A2T0LPQ0_9PSEU|nr:wax ester/triacylglycerol synthase domain-containing protein [Prauserella shujinwangii]PRX45208.1 WS/DGAT/MGAT family acyltransferase [Prauserella shujinwangii]
MTSRPGRRRPAGGAPAEATAISRMSANDLMTLATDVGTPPVQIAGIMRLDGGSALRPEDVVAAVAERVRGLPRFRQRLVRAPLGAGRPYWTDDPGFDVRRHLHVERCPEPGDDDALLAVANRAVTRRLPRDRPLWSATFVTGLAGEDAALVFVFHHVLTDGLGGLAVFIRMVDGAPVPATPGFPRPAPTRRRLYADATATRLRALTRWRSGLRNVRRAALELRTGRAAAPRSSLNRPIGPRRVFAVARTGVAAVRPAARAHGATLNDVVLTATTGALRALLRRRGETVDELVVSMPVSARGRDAGAALGNHVGAVPLPLPTAGATRDRLARIAALTRRRRGAVRGASATLLAPVFRILARLHLLEWFVAHQHLISTSITYLPGPPRRRSFLGTPVTEVVPLSTIKGNMTVSFVALSYAGRLTITAVADPGQFPDLPVLMAALRAELAGLGAAAPDGARPKSPAAGHNDTSGDPVTTPTVGRDSTETDSAPIAEGNREYRS